jgi:hypothetical protein
MTTSILDPEQLLKQLSRDGSASSVVPSDKIAQVQPVSVQDLFDRIKELFTPEEAEALARRIEEGREQAYD